MVTEVQDHREAIRSLCRGHRVRELIVFGLASRGTDFDPARSDIDLTVDFTDNASPDLAGQYLGLLEQLQSAPVQLAIKRTNLPRMGNFSDPRPEVLVAA